MASKVPDSSSSDDSDGTENEFLVQVLETLSIDDDQSGVAPFEELLHDCMIETAKLRSTFFLGQEQRKDQTFTRRGATGRESCFKEEKITISVTALQRLFYCPACALPCSFTMVRESGWSTETTSFNAMALEGFKRCQSDLIFHSLRVRSITTDVVTKVVCIPQACVLAYAANWSQKEHDSINLVSNIQTDEENPAPCINNSFKELRSVEDNNIQATYEILPDDEPCFALQEPPSECVESLKLIIAKHEVKDLLVIYAPNRIVYICGEITARVIEEIKELFSRYEFEIKTKNVVCAGGIQHISLLARFQKIFADFQKRVVQKETESELIVTAKEKQHDGSQLEAMYAIVPAHLLHSSTNESNQPLASINLVEPTSQQFIYTFVEDETQPCNLQATPIFKYRITTEVQSDEQGRSHMNDIAALKFEQNPKQPLNFAVKPLPIPKQSYINFLARRQSVVMIGGHLGRIVPLPINIGNDCWALGLHIAFVIPSTESSQVQRFEKGDCGKILHIQDKEGHWMPIAMLVGKYTVEIPEYGSSIYVAIILSEALNEIEKDFEDIISDIQLHPTSSLYSDDETEQSSEKYLCISSEEEFKHNKKRFTSLINLKELEVKDTNLASGDVKALERLTSLKKLTLHRCKFPKIRFGLLTNLEKLVVIQKLDSDALVDIGKSKSLEKLTLSFGTLTKFQFGLASLPNLKELSIYDSNIDSISPFAIESLDSLEQLFLRNCNFTKSPLRIASLPKLKKLDLYASKMDLDSSVVFENLVSLEKLDMHCCDLTKLPLRIIALPKLNELDFSYSKMDTTRPIVMKNLVSLEKLELHDCDLTKSVLRFDSLPSLKYLNASHSELDPNFLDDIGKLASLANLNMSFCKLPKHLNRLVLLKNLKELDVNCCKLDSEFFVGLEMLVSLEELNMRCCDVTKPPFRIASLPKLKRLDFSHSKMDSTGPVVIENLDLLEELDIRGWKLANSTLRIVSLPKLKRLDLSCSKMDFAGPVVIENLVSLEKLDIRGCKFANLTLRIASLSNLEELDFADCTIDSASSVVIESLDSLEKLDMRFCKLTKSSLRIASLSNLEELDIANCTIDSASSVVIESLDSLEKLAMRSCKLIKSLLSAIIGFTITSRVETRKATHVEDIIANSKSDFSDYTDKKVAALDLMVVVNVIVLQESRTLYKIVFTSWQL
ncbi:uncharacterized protein [Watersipora subatra]|uniref:uncharacterized protein n=1 Tax=Watersipora subatra TaxID=2589382 RepID=UPI00355C99EF